VICEVTCSAAEQDLLVSLDGKPNRSSCVQVIKDMEKFWQKQFDQNYSRSLDHRSFYFKSIDKKACSCSALLSFGLSHRMSSATISGGKTLVALSGSDWLH
jgi:hypothetical protein